MSTSQTGRISLAMAVATGICTAAMAVVGSPRPVPRTPAQVVARAAQAAETAKIAAETKAWLNSPTVFWFCDEPGWHPAAVIDRPVTSPSDCPAGRIYPRHAFVAPPVR